MSEFVVFYCANDGDDIKTDVGEEAADGAGEGVGGVDDVLFFLSGDRLECRGDGFLVPCLDFNDNEDVVFAVVCNDIEVFMSIVPIAGEDGIALLTEIFLRSVFTPFAEVVVSSHGLCFIVWFYYKWIP